MIHQTPQSLPDDVAGPFQSALVFHHHDVCMAQVGWFVSGSVSALQLVA